MNFTLHNVINSVDRAFRLQITTTTPSETFTLPIKNVSTLNFTVYWGDGSKNNISVWDDPNLIHTYLLAGDYTIKMVGKCPAFGFDNTGDRLKVKKIVSWGNLRLQYFNVWGCANLTSLPNQKGRLTSLITFSYAFAGTGITSIPDGFLDNSKVTDFTGTFSSSASLTSIPVNLFKNCSNVISVVACFGSSGITSIPADLFKYNTEIITFQSCFQDCQSLTSIPADLFKYNTKAEIFSFTFSGCIALTSLPVGLFRYNILATYFPYTFYYCVYLVSLPVDLFRYNTEAKYFQSCFELCYSITTLPADIFRYNIKAENFDNCFVYNGLEVMPDDLFRYNTTVITFAYCFLGTHGQQQKANMFYGAGEQGTRFLNQSVDFTGCFQRGLFWGTQGVAPDLWNCDFGTGTPTKDSCWGGTGNSTTSLTNYDDIPVAWGHS